MNRICRVALCATSSIAAYFIADDLMQSASAQTIEPQTSAQELQEVVVTARRVEERLQTVPISISVLNQRQLTDRNITTAADLALATPSLALDTQFGSENASFSLRSFHQDIGTASTVGVFFADVVAPRGGISNSLTHGGDGAGPGDFFDLTNVQVLKGPQGTLFGRNTTGGDILLVPEKPTPILGGYFETSFGNDSMEHQQGVINLPIDDRVRLRVGFDQQMRDGYMKSISGVGPSDFNDVNYVAGRVSLVLDVTDDLENYTIGRVSQSDTNGQLAKLIACNPAPIPRTLNPFTGAMACAQIARDQGPYVGENGAPDAESYLRTWQIINTTTWSANDDLTVKNIFSYGQLASALRNSLFGTNLLLPEKLFGAFPLGSLTGQQYYFGGSDAPLGMLGSDQQTFTEELQFHYVTLNDKLNLQAGGYTEGSSSLGTEGIEGHTLLACTDFQANQCTDPFSVLHRTVGNTHTYTGTIDYRDYGIYAQGTYSILDNLKFTAGVRWTRDVESTKENLITYRFPAANTPVPGCQLPANVATVATGCFLPLHVASQAPTWVMDLDWTPVEDLLTYVKYSRGYRAGGITPVGPIDPVIGTTFLTFHPEHVDTYEIGAKDSFRGEISGTLDIAAFYNDFSNQQLLTGFSSTQASQTSAIVNAGASKSYGLELNSTLIPAKGITLNLDYTYLNTRVDSVTNPVLPPSSFYTVVPQAVAGSVLPYSPHHKLSLTGTYRLPVEESLGKISVGATFTYTGTQAVNPLATYGWLKSYNTLNFNVNWEGIAGGPVDAEFFMTNALDHYYYTYKLDVTNNLGFASALVGEPRMFGARIRAHF